MSDLIKVGVQFNGGGLPEEVKRHIKAIYGLGEEAKDTSRDLGTLATQGDRAETSIDGLGTAATRSQQKIDGLGSRLSRGATGAARFANAIQSTGRAIQFGSEKIVNQYTAIAGGAGLGLIAKKTLDLDAQIQRAAINSRDALGKVDGKDMMTWIQDAKKGLREFSDASGIAPENLLAGLEQVRRMSGDVGLAMRQMGLASQVSVVNDAQVTDVLGLIDVLNKKAGISEKEMRSTVNMIAAMGQQGAFDIAEFAGQGAAMMTVLPQFGTGGKVDQKAVQSLTALANIAMSANGNNAEMARTSILALGADMADLTILKASAKKAGLNKGQYNDLVYTDKSHKTRRSAEDFLKRMIEITGGNVEQITVMLNESSRKIANDMANNWKQNGGKFAYLDSLKSAGDASRDGDLTGQGFGWMSKQSRQQLNMAWEKTRGVMEEFSRLLIDGISPALRIANDHATIFKTGIILLGTAIATAAGIVVAGKAKQLFTEALTAIRGGRSGLGGAGGLGGIPGGATPVFVVNMGGGLGGVPGSVAADAAAGVEGGIAQAASRTGIFSRFSGWLGTAGRWIGGQAQQFGVWGQGKQYAVERMLGRTAAGRWAMGMGAGLAERGSGLWRNLTWGSGMGGLARLGGRMSPMLRGMGIGALMGIPIEYLTNGVSMRSTVAGVGGAVGGTLGFMGGAGLGAATTWGAASVPLALAGSAGGGWAGREGSLALYDLIAGMFDAQNKVATAAGKDSVFAPQLNVGINFDAMGRPTTTVDGPGASMMRVNTPALGPRWAPAAMGG